MARWGLGRVVNLLEIDLGLLVRDPSPSWWWRLGHWVSSYPLQLYVVVWEVGLTWTRWEREEEERSLFESTRVGYAREWLELIRGSYFAYLSYEKRDWNWATKPEQLEKAEMREKRKISQTSFVRFPRLLEPSCRDVPLIGPSTSDRKWWVWILLNGYRSEPNVHFPLPPLPRNIEGLGCSYHAICLSRTRFWASSKSRRSWGVGKSEAASCFCRILPKKKENGNERCISRWRRANADEEEEMSRLTHTLRVYLCTK